MSARHLVVGLDGADLELVLTLGKARLPHLFGLMERGVYAHQRSLLPPATLPNWTTFLTGVDPGRHGVFDFTTRHGYSVRFSAGTVREAPTWIARLDRMGMACACVGFPATWPPERLRHGVFISGWDAPVSFEADASFVWPRSLYTLLRRRFGPLRFDEVDQFRADQPGWHEQLGTRLCDKIARRAELAGFLLGLRAWDVFAFYFGESDTASHYLYSLFDEASPRRPAQVTPRQQAGLGAVYEALDRALGQLLDAAGSEVEVTVVSDHGSGGSSDKLLYLNRALAQLGFLRFKPATARSRWPAALKTAALSRLSPRLRDRLFRAASARLPSWLESQARFGAIDMDHTRAFSDELNYFPALYLNVRGREPRGCVAPNAAPALIEELRDALLTLRDPETKRPVIEAVHRREELFEGPCLARAPDLLLSLRLDRGYSYNLVPSAPAARDAPVFSRLSPADYLGKKGRSLPGSHRPLGLMVAAGPRVVGRGQVEIDIAGTSALVLARVGAAMPEGARAHIPAGVIAPGASAPLPELPVARAGAGDVAALEARLRALGYVD
jgi:predicted AlkP superfamily phosphohydrolase/phosphomutase